jgi:hypothetical protein
MPILNWLNRKQPSKPPPTPNIVCWQGKNNTVMATQSPVHYAKGFEQLLCKKLYDNWGLDIKFQYKLEWEP